MAAYIIIPTAITDFTDTLAAARMTKGSRTFSYARQGWFPDSFGIAYTSDENGGTVLIRKDAHEFYVAGPMKNQFKIIGGILACSPIVMFIGRQLGRGTSLVSSIALMASVAATNVTIDYVRQRYRAICMPTAWWQFYIHQTIAFGRHRRIIYLDVTTKRELDHIVAANRAMKKQIIGVLVGKEEEQPALWQYVKQAADRVEYR